MCQLATQGQCGLDLVPGLVGIAKQPRRQSRKRVADHARILSIHYGMRPVVMGIVQGQPRLHMRTHRRQLSTPEGRLPQRAMCFQAQRSIIQREARLPLRHWQRHRGKLWRHTREMQHTFRLPVLLVPAECLQGEMGWIKHHRGVLPYHARYAHIDMRWTCSPA